MNKNDGKINQKTEVFRISNTVPADLKKRPEKPLQSQSYQRLEAISKNERKNRLLIDWFSASLSPLISPSNWTLVQNDKGEIIKVPIAYSGNPEIVGNYADAKNDFKITKLKRYGNLKVLTPDDFFEWFFSEFDFLDVSREENGVLKYDEFGGGEGFNAGRSYSLFRTDERVGEKLKNPKIVFKFFDPDKAEGEYKSRSAYTDSGAEANYVRQKISMILSGNALQGLREHDLFMRFFRTLYRCFRNPVVTRFDGTLDLFNYGFKPKYFSDLAERNKYLSYSHLNVVGAFDNPSVYIGAFKRSRTIVMYDKRAENIDKNEADEPELLEAVRADDNNTWLRCEQTFTSHENEASQIFEELIGDTWDVTGHKVWNHVNSEYSAFIAKLGTILKTTFGSKCRFLKQAKKEKNNERIGTDKYWQLILDVLSEASSGFTFARPKLTLEDRKANFIYRSLGGPKLFADILAIEGPEGLTEFFEDVKARAVAILESSEQK